MKRLAPILLALALLAGCGESAPADDQESSSEFHQHLRAVAQACDMSRDRVLSITADMDIYGGDGMTTESMAEGMRSLAIEAKLNPGKTCRVLRHWVAP